MITQKDIDDLRLVRDLPIVRSLYRDLIDKIIVMITLLYIKEQDDEVDS